ncbi:hypothetical protein DFH09DRAFT_377500 [Mycena vulgaris]|nr:hypothetical protein DFH09DRAFT_377500 [Mycena vulgaris]
MIPLGDIDLRREIKLNWRTGVVERQRRCIRNVYSARICGLSDMTVALYQGAGSEEEWLEDISKVSWLRHPSFVQIYGAASSGGIHAAIFHGDLIPLRQVHDLYCHSHFATVCFWVSSVSACVILSAFGRRFSLCTELSICCKSASLSYPRLSLCFRLPLCISSYYRRLGCLRVTMELGSDGLPASSA